MKKSFCISSLVVLSTIAAGSVRAALLGVNVTPPVIVYANTGSQSTSYNPISQIFTVTTTPSTIKFTATEPTFSILTTRSMKIAVQVNNFGTLVGGVTGPDLVISGRVQRIVGTVTNTYIGLLLTGEVTAFGYQDSGTVVDNYDFRFTPTGGLLQSLFQCDHIGVTLVSEGSTFIGSFAVPFNGQSKGTVGLEDQTPPTITCPFENINVTNVQCSAAGGQAGAYVTFPNPTGTDNCDTNVMISCSPTNGSFFALSPGTNMTSHTVTCTAIDASGNQDSCAFTVTIEDVLPPDFNDNSVIDACNADNPYLLTNDVGQCYSTFTFQKPTAMDSCCTSAVPVSVSAIDENGFIITLTEFTTNGIVYETGQFPVNCVSSNVITSTANDGRGNTAQHQCPVFVFDTELPMITCASNQTAECTNAPVFYTEPIASDNCTNLTVSCTPTNGSFLSLGMYTVTCLAIDGCGGNTNSCSFTLNVVDTTPPAISCPTNVTVECGQSTEPSNTGTATASDTCDSNPLVTHSDNVSGACPVFIYRTWTAIDHNGNSNQCTQVITVRDTTPPSISCPSDKQLACGASTAPSNTGMATGTDTCSAVSIGFIDAAGPTNCTGQVGINRTWFATNLCSNMNFCVQHITFVDTTPPVISCPATVTANTDAGQCSASGVALGNPTATDNCGGTPSVTNNAPTQFAKSTNAVIWTATDGCGNSSACTQKVIVVDNQAPVLNGCPAPTTNNQCFSQVPSAPTVTATDNCDGSVPVRFSETQSNPGSSCSNTITRTWTANDSSGNTNSCSQTITVNDVTPPMLAGCTNQVAFQQQVVTNSSSCIAANFNGTPISAGNWIWFNSVFKAQGTNTTYTIKFTGQTITGTIGASNVTQSVPDAQITVSSAFTNATTTFTGGKWVTTAPLGLGGNTFLSGLAYHLPFSSAGSGNLNWCGSFIVTPGVTVNWQWAAAVYTNLTATYSSLGVKPVDSSSASIYKNSDHAGTPENYKKSVVGGARGGGGSNFTGSYSATKVANVGGTVVCSGGAVQYTQPTATDACGNMTSVNCMPLPGTGFTAGSTNVTCTAMDDCGNVGICSFTLTLSNCVTCTASSIPSGVKISAVTGKITLTWSASTGTAPITYNVKRATTSGGPYTTIASGISTLTYGDTALVKGVKYYYVISSSNCAGASANSSSVNTTAK